MIPVDYRSEKFVLNDLLDQINGLFIPGDNVDILTDAVYQETMLQVV